MRPGALAVAMALATLVAGCSDQAAPEVEEPVGPATDEAGQTRLSRGFEVRTEAMRLYEGEREVAFGALAEDGSFDVPAGTVGLSATLFLNGTGCWELHGAAPPRSGETFPNPFIDLVAPSGAVHAFETSIWYGCETVSQPYEQDALELPSEAGTWTVRHDVQGTGIRLTVLVDALVPKPSAD